jgi:hypothetical protein
MANHRAFLAVFLAPALMGSAATASAARDVRSQPAANGSIVTDHIPQFDGPLTIVTGADGRTWATWTYRAAGEFDIAVSSREASGTAWSAPIFFGRRSGSDEIDSTVAVDSQGATYVAFATTNPSRVAIAMLAAGSSTWSAPVIVSGTEAASSPALRLVGDRLVVAYRTVRGVGMVDLPTIGSGNHTDGINDGPDGIDPLGAKDRAPLGGPSPTP